MTVPCDLTGNYAIAVIQRLKILIFCQVTKTKPREMTEH